MDAGRQVLLLWDRIIGFDSLLPLPLLAAAIFSFRCAPPPPTRGRHGLMSVSENRKNLAHKDYKKLKFPDFSEFLEFRGQFSLFHPYFAKFSDGHMSVLRPIGRLCDGRARAHNYLVQILTS